MLTRAILRITIERIKHKCNASCEIGIFCAKALENMTYGSFPSLASWVFSSHKLLFSPNQSREKC